MRDRGKEERPRSIVVKEIPYQVNRKRLLEKLGELVRDKKLPEISNIHDAADRKGIDIIIDLKSNAIPQVVLNKLFKHTQLQVGFGCNMLALVNGTPRVLSLKEILSTTSSTRKTSSPVAPATSWPRPRSASTSSRLHHRAR